MLLILPVVFQAVMSAPVNSYLEKEPGIEHKDDLPPNTENTGVKLAAVLRQQLMTNNYDYMNHDSDDFSITNNHVEQEHKDNDYSDQSDNFLNPIARSQVTDPSYKYDPDEMENFEDKHDEIINLEKAVLERDETLQLVKENMKKTERPYEPETSPIKGILPLHPQPLHAVQTNFSEFGHKVDDSVDHSHISPPKYPMPRKRVHGHHSYENFVNDVSDRRSNLATANYLHWAKSMHRSAANQQVNKKDLLYYMDDSWLTPSKLFTAETVPDYPERYVRSKSKMTKPRQKRYKLLKMAGGRRSGAGRKFIQEEGAEGIVVAKVDDAPFPDFRLPSNRRQYMSAADVTEEDLDSNRLASASASASADSDTVPEHSDLYVN